MHRLLLIIGCACQDKSFAELLNVVLDLNINLLHLPSLLLFLRLPRINSVLHSLEVRLEVTIAVSKGQRIRSLVLPLIHLFGFFLVYVLYILNGIPLE